MHLFNQTMQMSFYFSAERLKRDFDKAFGAPWNVIVGECYSFDIDYDFHFVFYFLYGPVAILAWRVRVFSCIICILITISRYVFVSQCFFVPTSKLSV